MKVVAIIIEALFCIFYTVSSLLFGFWVSEEVIPDIWMPLCFLVASILCLAVSVGAIVKIAKKRPGYYWSALLMKITCICAGFSLSYFTDSEPAIEAAVVFLIVTFLSAAASFYLGNELGGNEIRGGKKSVSGSTYSLMFMGYKAKYGWDVAAEEYLEKSQYEEETRRSGTAGVTEETGKSGKVGDSEETGKSGKVGDSEEIGRVSGSVEKYSVEELTDEENEKIYEYASMPVIYMLRWLIENEFMSAEYYETLGYAANEMAEKMRNGELLPMDVYCSMDYSLCEEDISRDIYMFMCTYFQDTRNHYVYGNKTSRFMFDYYEVIKNPHRWVFCVEYSDSDYKKLKEKIDAAFNYSRCEDLKLFDDCVNANVHWDRYGVDLSFARYYDGDDGEEDMPALAKKYEEALNSLSDSEIFEFCKYVDSVWGYDVTGEYLKEHPEEAEDVSRAAGVAGVAGAAGVEEQGDFRKISDEKVVEIVLRETRFYELLVFNSKDETEPDFDSFVLCGEASYEEEHGISATFRHGKFVAAAYGMDYEDPKSTENESLYQRKVFDEYIKNSGLAGEALIQKLLDEGKLLKVNLIPAILGGSDGEDNKIYITPIAAKQKEISDARIDALMAFNEISGFKYELKHDRKGLSSVPSRIIIRATLGDKVIFSETIDV